MYTCLRFCFAPPDDGAKKMQGNIRLALALDAVEKTAREHGLDAESITTVVDIMTRRNFGRSVHGVSDPFVSVVCAYILRYYWVKPVSYLYFLVSRSRC